VALKQSLAATVALVALISAAQGADMPLKAPRAVGETIYNWTGFYAGIQGGFAWGTSNHRQDDSVQLHRPVQTNDFDISGAVGGGTWGYNWQISQYVFGLESDISASDINGSHPQPGSGGFGCGSGPCETFVRWFGTTRARAGVTVSDRTLLYATGGAAYGRLFAQIPSDPAFTGSENKWGWTAGGGIEYGLSPNLSVKAEYLFVDFGRFVYGADHPHGTTLPPATALANFSLVRAGLNWHFGGPDGARY
jgi:outer membrane immunogenic protein